MNLYNDLTLDPDSRALNPAPTAIWAIVSYEFPIIYQGCKFLLFTQPYYGAIESSVNAGEGILYPPFTAYVAPTGHFPVRTLGDARRRAYQQIEKYISDPNNFSQLAYNLGLGEPEFEMLNPPIDELKVSPRNHHVQKYFRLFRVRAWNNPNASSRNIFDPEFIKGHYIVPLDGCEEIDLPPEFAGPHEYRFKSKVLASHYRKLSDFYKSDRNSDKYTYLTDMDLTNKEDGWLISFDLSGFGAFNKMITDKLSNPLEAGVGIAERFRSRLVALFDKFCAEIGTAQFRFMGDGFVCGIPYRFVGKDPAVFWTRFTKARQRLCDAVDAMNRQMPAGSMALGSRIALLECSYLFGRIGGADSTFVDFEGASLIDLARAEQHIAAYMRETPSPGRHILGIPRSGGESALEHARREFVFLCEDEKNVKEHSSVITLFSDK